MAKTKRSRKKRGITRQWIAVSLVTTVLILALASVVIVLSMRRTYYDNARQVLEYRLSYTLLSIQDNNTSDARAAALRDVVENFSEIDRGKFEFMLLNERGGVIATSSGFAYSPDEPMDDFYEATTSGDGLGIYIGNSESGEHIIAVTQMLMQPAGEIRAIRYVSSLANIDTQLWRILQIDIAICVVVILFTLLSGFYFVRSIVVLLSEVGRTASRIADGDLNVRVDNIYNDEIGELGDIINDMAAGLSVTDRMKNEFISNVSHELRTPLTSIRGWGETLKSVGSDDPAVFDKGMDIIISETERLSVLVEDLLDFSRLQSGGRMKVEPVKMDVRPEVTHVVQTFEQRAKNLGIKLKYKEKGDPVMILGDRNRLRQVFSNIMDNAIKYSKYRGTIHVDIQKKDGNAVIVVEDNGIGIPEEELSKITERFYKASNSVTGSGIGLAVVKEIIVLHDGTIRFDSELGEGTKVTMTIPLAQ